MAKKENGRLLVMIPLEVCAADRAAIAQYYGLDELAREQAVRTWASGVLNSTLEGLQYEHAKMIEENDAKALALAEQEQRARGEG